MTLSALLTQEPATIKQSGSSPGQRHILAVLFRQRAGLAAPGKRYF